jgi:hypothetical protein
VEFGVDEVGAGSDNGIKIGFHQVILRRRNQAPKSNTRHAGGGRVALCD